MCVEYTTIVVKIEDLLGQVQRDNDILFIFHSIFCIMVIFLDTKDGMKNEQNIIIALHV
jgi:hypothetical protein